MNVRTITNQVNWTTSGNIDGTQFVQEAVLTPNPSSRYAIDGRVQKGKYAIGFEVATAKKNKT